MLCHALQRFASLALAMHQGSLAKQLLNKQWLQEHMEAKPQGLWDIHDNLAAAGSKFSHHVVLCAFLPSQQALRLNHVSCQG